MKLCPDVFCKTVSSCLLSLCLLFLTTWLFFLHLVAVASFTVAHWCLFEVAVVLLVTRHPPTSTPHLFRFQNAHMWGFKVGDGGDCSMELIARILRRILRWGVHSCLCRTRGCYQKVLWLEVDPRVRERRAWRVANTECHVWSDDEPNLNYSQYRKVKSQFLISIIEFPSIFGVSSAADSLMSFLLQKFPPLPK